MLPKIYQYGHHKLDNRFFIFLPLLVSAYLQQGKSAYVPGNPAAPE